MNRTVINQKANKEIKKQIEQLHLEYCEICGELNYWMTIMHRHKRRWYYDKLDKLLWDKSQWIFACITCHDYYEKCPKKTEQIFQKIRGDE